MVYSQFSIRNGSYKAKYNLQHFVYIMALIKQIGIIKISYSKWLLSSKMECSQFRIYNGLYKAKCNLHNFVFIMALIMQS